MGTYETHKTHGTSSDGSPSISASAPPLTSSENKKPGMR